MRHHFAAVDGVLTHQFSRSGFLTTASLFDRQCTDEGEHSSSCDGSVVVWLRDSFLEAHQSRVCFFSPQTSSVDR